MPIETLQVSDETFDGVLERFAVVDESLELKETLNRPLEKKEILDRYAFTAFVEALRSEDFEEDPFMTAAELELEQEFDSENSAWEAIKEFYASRGCLVLIVGESEEFIVGREVLSHLGLLQ
jgi:hypothetical protein